MNEQQKAPRYKLYDSADRSFMEEVDNGDYVKFADYDQLRQRLADAESQLSNAISLLGEVREDGNYYLLGEIKDAVAAYKTRIDS